MEVIYIDDIPTPHQVIHITPDGQCLFSSLAYFVFDSDSLGFQVRTRVVQHIANNWRRFKPYTAKPTGNIYRTKAEYVDDMSKPRTFGTTCEIKAASEIFPYEFQVYRNGTFWVGFGEPIRGIKRMRFMGSIDAGHFDVLIPQDPHPIPEQSLPSNNVPGVSHISDTDPQESRSPSPAVSCTLSNTSEPEPSHVDNKKRGKKRRKRFSNTNRTKAHRDAVKKYSQNNPDVNREAVKKYTKKILTLIVWL